MPQRTTITIFALLASLATLFFLAIQSPGDRYTMAGPNSNPANEDVQLSLKLATAPNNKLRITITNHDSTTARTFLRWDTPFDPRAIDMEILTLKDAESGSEVPSPGLKVSRKLPPPHEDLIEVPAGGEVSEEIELKAPWLPSDGRKMQVAAAEGEWKAVWKKGKDEVKDEELADFGGEDVVRGAFRSEGTGEVTV